MEEKYADILNLPRPVSTRHAPMSMVDRGAQFSPFAALTGFDGVLEESARLTQEETFLAEHGKELLGRKLRAIAADPEGAGEVSFSCFRQDARKRGGSYVTVAGRVKKFDMYRKTVLLQDGQEIEIETIRGIASAE